MKETSKQEADATEMRRVWTAGLQRILAVAAIAIGVESGAVTVVHGAALADVFARFGLLGIWSPNCSAPASRLNPRVIWRVSSGVVIHSVSFDGREVTLLDTVASAKIVNQHDLQLTHKARGQYPATVVVRMVEGHLWTIYSAGADGHIFYDQGVEVSTGKPSVIDERCEALTSWATR